MIEKAQLLILDAELYVRSLLSRTLGLIGYSVEETDSGQEALALLEHFPFDLLILDVHLPDVDGIELIRRARQLRPELLIIILTGHTTLESAIAAVKLGVADYLAKPINVDQVVETVARVLQKRTEQLRQRHLMHIIGQAAEALQQISSQPTARSAPDTGAGQIIYVYPLTLNCQACLVMLDDNPPHTLELSRRETAVLASLMSQPNQVLSCCQLVQAAWGHTLSESDAQNIIRPYISRLRHKLGTVCPYRHLIHTVRGQGYCYLPGHPDEIGQTAAFSENEEISDDRN